MSFLARLNDAQAVDACLTLLSTSGNGQSRTGRFVLAVGSTETSDLPGISAAGATAEMRRLTPSTDAEALVLGKTVSGDAIPASPAGIVSPVVITRACLGFVDCPVLVVDCGTFRPPAVPATTLGTGAARCLSTGAAMSLDHVQSLFERGLALGAEMAACCDYLVVSECVPAGTTTAMGVLTALGYDVRGLLSSSLPVNDHDVRSRVVKEGLAKSGLDLRESRDTPLAAVAALGDPMQPVAAGLVMSASLAIPVVLAGGSQMLAVWSLARHLSEANAARWRRRATVVITTKWVAFDPAAGCARLAALVGAPFAAACPDFMLSRHSGLRAYEDGHVKEGVGAGASLALANFLAGASDSEIVAACDRAYDELVLGLAALPN